MALTREEQMELDSLDSRTRSYMNKDWLTPSERSDYDALVSRRDSLMRRSDDTGPQVPDSGINYFSGGPQPPLSGFPADPVLSIPAPVAPVLPAPVPSSPTVDPDNTILTAPPVPGQTQFLPLTGDPKHDSIIRTTDAALSQINDSLFSLNPADINGYDAAHLGGPGGPEKLNSLSDVASSLNTYSGNLKDEFQAIRSTVEGSDSTDTWMSRIQQMYKPSLDAADAGVGANGATQKAQEALTDCGEGINRNFDVFRSAIRSARENIASLYTKSLNGPYVLDQTKALSFDPAPLQALEASKSQLDDAQVRLANSAKDWVIPLRSVAPDGSIQYSNPENTPVVLTPGANPDDGRVGGGLVDGGQPGGLGVTAPGTAMPQGQQMYGMPMSGYGPIGQLAQQIPPVQLPQFSPIQIPDPTAPFAPLVSDAIQSTKLSSDQAQAEQASALKQAQAAAEQQRERATADSGNAATNSVMANAVSRPGEAVRPGALGADGLPLDKDGDGKMDSDSVALTEENRDRDGDGNPDPLTTTVSADGREVPVTVSDPRLAEIMNRMSEGTSDNPVRVLDAMQESGIAASDYGRKIDTMELRPGDVVTGVGKGMYLGEGLVLTEKGDIKGLPEVMDFRNSSSTPAAYRIELPELPNSVDSSGIQPVNTEQPEQPAPRIEPASETAPVSGPVGAAEPVYFESARTPDAAAPAPVSEQPASVAPSPADIPVSQVAPTAPTEPVTAPSSETFGTNPPLAAEVPPVSAPETPPVSATTSASEFQGPVEVPYQGRPLG